MPKSEAQTSEDEVVDLTGSPQDPTLEEVLAYLAEPKGNLRDRVMRAAARRMLLEKR